MLNALLAWLRPQNNKTLLADLLSSKDAKEELLGMAQLKLPTPGQVLNDINKVLNYSQSADYKVWAAEAWSKILLDLDALLNPKATQEEINFYRGKISSTLALLRISYQARLKEPAIKKQAESTTRR